MDSSGTTKKDTTRSQLVCRICGDVARGLNFDVMTCMACKAFFRRNALRVRIKLLFLKTEETFLNRVLFDVLINQIVK